MAQRRCCGYDTDPDGELVIKSDEPAIVRWIFDRYLSGDSLGKIAAGLGKVVDMLYAKQIPLPIGKEKWTRAAVDHLLNKLQVHCYRWPGILCEPAM